MCCVGGGDGKEQKLPEVDMGLRIPSCVCLSCIHLCEDRHHLERRAWVAQRTEQPQSKATSD